EPKTEVVSMPGVFQYPLHELEEEMRVVESLGIKAVILFGIPAEKDAVGTQAYHDHGIIQEATRLIKKSFPKIL
ncbi:porphobilinogen synthase, partial [Escherichia coli]|nr:porphobilinogen synthase [Escherichia coli]